MLHGARRRRAAGRVRHAVVARSRAGRSRPSRVSTRRCVIASAAAFVATGGSQCGFCTPGIVMRVRRAGAFVTSIARWPRTCAGAPAGAPCTTRSAATAAGRRRPCRRVAISMPRRGAPSWKAASRKRVRADVPLGGAHFADDTAPRDALVAVPLPPGRRPRRSRRPGCDGWSASRWPRPAARPARCRAGARRSRNGRRCSTVLAPCPPGGVRLATSWVEPAYLEPDASWCEPGGEPASPYVNGGAFGGKLDSAAPRAARELADRSRASRAGRLLARRRRAARAEASADGGDRGRCARRARRDRGRGRAAAAGRVRRDVAVAVLVRRCRRAGARSSRRSAGRHASCGPRAWPSRRCSWRARSTRPASTARRSPTTRRCLDTCVRVPSGASAGARVHIDPATGALERIEVRVAAGDPLDEIVLRSYAIGAAHMALGWVCTESLTVDPATGEVHDLTIRSFGILRAKDMPPIDVEVLDDPREPLGGCVRRGVRRGRGRHVERARPRRRRAAGYVPGPSDACRAPAQEVGDARCSRSDAERARGGRPVFAGRARRRLVGARRPGRARSRDRTHGRGRRRGRRPARCWPTSRRSSATAARRSPTSPRPPCSSPTWPTSRVVNAVYADAFGAHRPARSTVQVAALPGGAQVEIETWAHLPA